MAKRGTSRHSVIPGRHVGIRQAYGNGFDIQQCFLPELTLFARHLISSLIHYPMNCEQMDESNEDFTDLH